MINRLRYSSEKQNTEVAMPRAYRPTEFESYTLKYLMRYQLVGG